jgi:hypothetical protein
MIAAYSSSVTAGVFAAEAITGAAIYEGGRIRSYGAIQLFQQIVCRDSQIYWGVSVGRKTLPSLQY